MFSSALKRIRHQPIYAIGYVTTLAIAVAAAATSIAVVKRAFFDPLPYADDSRLVLLVTMIDNRISWVSPLVLEDLKNSDQRLLTGFAAVRSAVPTFQTRDSAHSIEAHEVTPAYFETLGVRPTTGAVWPEGDFSAVVVSWRFFQRFLSGDPDRIGGAIVLDGTARTVVGVMSEEFLAPYAPNVDLWLALDGRTLLADPSRGRRDVSVYARLAPGVSKEQANVYLASFTESQRVQYPAIHAQESWIVRSFREGMVGSTRPLLVGLAAGATLLMLIVWANIGSLSTVVAARQQYEIGIRASLGATPSRLFWERFREALVISVSGAVAGLALAQGALIASARYQLQFLRMFEPASLDIGTATVALGFGIASGVFAALAPRQALKRLARERPLLSNRTATGDLMFAGFRSSLIVVQCAIALVLLVGAGLLVRSVRHLGSTSVGYETSNVAFFDVRLPLPRYADAERQIAFERTLHEQLERIPGVTHMASAIGVPVVGSLTTRVSLVDRVEQRPVEVVYYAAGPGYFGFLGVPIGEGRDFADTDDSRSPTVAVVNETMSRMLWPEGRALGAKIRVSAGAPTDREFTIVGVARDIRQGGVTQDVRPTVFLSTRQFSSRTRQFMIRTHQANASVETQAHAEIHKLDPEAVAGSVTYIDEIIGRQTARPRVVMFMLVVFGAVATALCGAGLYATVALSSQSRRREYAIRVALGASRSSIQWMVLRQALILATIGTISGLVVSGAGTSILQGLLHGVTPLDTVTFVGMPCAMVLVAVVAAMWPAVNAGKSDPAEALRSE